MRLEDYERIKFVKAHHGWAIKLERYMAVEPYESVFGHMVVHNELSFVQSFAQDIDKTIEILKEKGKL